MIDSIDPIKPLPGCDGLGSGDVERLREATLSVLESTGARFPSPRALDVLERGRRHAARSYRVPVVRGAMASGAKQPDRQAAVDGFLITFVSVIAGVDLRNDAGCYGV